MRQPRGPRRGAVVAIACEEAADAAEGVGGSDRVEGVGEAEPGQVVDLHIDCAGKDASDEAAEIGVAAREELRERGSEWAAVKDVHGENEGIVELGSN